MAAAWPITLNSYILSDSYLPYVGGNSIVTENENGPRQVRCRYTAVSWFHPVQLKFTPAEYTVFLTFFQTTLRYGTLSFYFPLPSRTNPLVTSSRLCRMYFEANGKPFTVTQILADTAIYVSFTLEEFAQ